MKNGIYIATKDNMVYLVKFENNISKQGLKQSDLGGTNFNEYFKNSSFHSVTGWSYAPANSFQTYWLEECIKYDKFVSKPKTIPNLTNLIFN